MRYGRDGRLAGSRIRTPQSRMIRLAMPFLYGMHRFRGGTARTGRLQLRPRRVPPLCHRWLSRALSQASSRISRHQDDCYVAGANDFRNIEGGRRSFKLDRKLQHPSALGMVGDRKVTTRIGKSPTINTAGADVRRREKDPVQAATRMHSGRVWYTACDYRLGMHDWPGRPSGGVRARRHVLLE